MFVGKPVYEKRVGSKNYYIYYYTANKAWYIGDSIGSTSPLMKTGDTTDQACPADPSTPKTQKWKRKNAFGFWGKDNSMIIKCI